MTVSFDAVEPGASVTSGLTWPYKTMLINQGRLAAARRWRGWSAARGAACSTRSTRWAG